MAKKSGASKYFSKNPNANSLTHFLLGVGVGILITYPYVGLHPVRWGMAFLVAGAIGYVMAMKD